MTMKTLPLHQNGHNVLGPSSDGTVQVILMEYKGITEPHMVTHLFTCSSCGAYPAYEIKGEAVHLSGGPCQYAKGITTAIRIKVPSGKIVFTDDLRPQYNGYDDTYEKFAPYGSKLGVSQVIEEFARQGCAFGFVGDAWPDLFQVGAGAYVLASPAWSDEEDDTVTPEGWTKLAEGGGDIWSYCIADYEDWKAKGGVDADLAWKGTVVEIPAGEYEFVYHGGEAGFDRHAAGLVEFTHIFRVG